MRYTIRPVVLLVALLLVAPPLALAASFHGVDPDWGSATQASSGDPGVVSSGGVGRKIAVDAQNRIHLVWTEQRGTSYDIFYSRSTDGGVSWSEGHDIFTDTAPLPALAPNIAAGPAGTLHLAWNDRRDGAMHVYYSRSFDGGDTWEEPRPISPITETLDAAAPSLSVDTSGRVHVAWHIGNPDGSPITETAQIYYARSTDGGETFEAPRRLNSELGEPYHAAWPRFTVEGTSGEVVAIAWRDNRRRPDWDVYLALSTDGGETFQEIVGQATENRDWDPEALVDSSGNVHLTYTTFYAGLAEAAPPAVNYRRASLPDLIWTDPITVSEARSKLSSWAADPTGRALCLWWKDERDAVPGPGGDPRSDIATKYSLDGGRTWSALEFVTDQGDTDVRFPSLAVGPDGRPHAMWSERHSGPDGETVYVKSRLVAAQSCLYLPAVVRPVQGGAGERGRR